MKMRARARALNGSAFSRKVDDCFAEVGLGLFNDLDIIDMDFKF